MPGDGGGGVPGDGGDSGGGVPGDGGDGDGGVLGDGGDGGGGVPGDGGVLGDGGESAKDPWRAGDSPPPRQAPWRRTTPALVSA